jgi:hypothetical protein
MPGRMTYRWWIALAALYVLLAWSLSPPELAVAAIAATVGTIAAALTGARVALPVRRVARQLPGLFTDLVPLARALAARRGGRFERVPLEDASEAVAEAVGSLAPASIVVRIDQDSVLVHRL